MGGPKQSDRPHLCSRLERQLCFDLHGPWRCISTQERPENAGGRAHSSNDASELGAGNIVNRLIEVEMVEEIKNLSADLELRALPVRNRKILHESQIGIEEHRAIDLVPALVAESRNAPGANRRSELRRVHTGHCCCRRVARAGVLSSRLFRADVGQDGSEQARRRRHRQGVRGSRQAAVLAVREKVEGWGQIAFLLLFGSSRKGWCSNTRRRPNLHLVPT